MNSDNSLLSAAISGLRQLLPTRWRVGEIRAEPQTATGVDATVTIVAPDDRTGVLVLEARANLSPKEARSVAGPLREATAALGTLVVVARYLSSATQLQLREAGVGYLDLTGNVRVMLSTPGLYLERSGATQDPDRENRTARSLRGPKAGAIVRTLVDRKEPPGVRELAELAGVDAGYASRVLAFLDAEAIVTRVKRGRLTSVDWPALLRRWAQDAPLESRGTARTYLAARGLPALMERLASFGDDEYAITGSLAATTWTPTMPARLATIWIRNASEAASALGLRVAESGANVLLTEPRDDAAFVGAESRPDGLVYAAPSQVAADLLTSPGRGPAEGELLITWMQENEDAWRR